MSDLFLKKDKYSITNIDKLHIYFISSFNYIQFHFHVNLLDIRVCVLKAYLFTLPRVSHGVLVKFMAIRPNNVKYRSSLI